MTSSRWRVSCSSSHVFPKRTRVRNRLRCCHQPHVEKMDDLKGLIAKVNAGEPGAQDALFTAAYSELRKLARSRLHDGGRNTCLDTTALVHESYLRFIKHGQLRSEDRRAFFDYASRVMRSVIVDSVRERQALCRGGDLDRMTLNTQLVDGLPAGEDELLQVNEAIEALAKTEPYSRHPGRFRPSDRLLAFLESLSDHAESESAKTCNSLGNQEIKGGHSA